MDETLEQLRAAVADLTRRVALLEGRHEPSRAAEPLPARPVDPVPPRDASTQSAPVVTNPPTADRARSADIEQVIGQQWLSRLGIAAVLVGTAYFLKYAFDNRWIGPSGRISIGLAAGIAITIWSQGFRRRGHRFFAHTLMALGVGILYLSLWAAYQLYHLLPASAAAIAMAVVTVATATLAVRQKAEILALFAATGGFATPMLLATGENRQIQLFSYIALLDIAAIAVAAMRGWTRTVLLSFIGTLVLYSAWYSRFYSDSQSTATIMFATFFHLLFASVPLLPSVRTRQGFATAALPLANATAYFVQLHLILKDAEILAWAAVLLAALNLAIARAAARGASPDRGLLHVAVAISFLVIAIPLRLDQQWITLGWLAQAAVLFEVGRRTGSRLVRTFAGAALMLSLFRLVAIDSFPPEQTYLLANLRFVSYAGAVALLFAIGRRSSEPARAAAEPSSDLTRFCYIAANVLVFTAVNLEISDAFSASDQPRGRELLGDLTRSGAWLLHGTVLIATGLWKRAPFLRWLGLLLIGVTTGKVFLYDLSALERIYRIISFIVLGAVLLAISFFYQRLPEEETSHQDGEAPA